MFNKSQNSKSRINAFVRIFVALFTVFVVYGGYTIYADEGSYSFESSVEFYSAFNSYQGEMNSLFNDRIAKLNELLESEDFYNDVEKNKKFLPPTNIDAKNDKLEVILEKCGDENVSTYCVSMHALDRYTKYVQKIDGMKGQVDMEGLRYLPLFQALEQVGQNDDRIEEEIIDAKKVMEATLAVYNEYRLAYPMHRKYELIAKDLIKYKLELKDIRNRVTVFPSKFIDATSSQCK